MPDNAAPLILLTRPKAAAERFAARLRSDLGADLRCLIAPLIEIVRAAPVPDLGGFAGVILTSEMAVAWIPSPVPPALPAWCVGDRTASVARAAGFDARSAQGTAEDLVALILRDRPTGRIVHLHGVHTRGDVVERLRAEGVAAEGLAIYDQVETDAASPIRAALAPQGPVLVPLFSPRSAQLFGKAAGRAPGAAHATIAISGAVMDSLPPEWKPTCHLAATPDADGMIEAMRNFISH